MPVDDSWTMLKGVHAEAAGGQSNRWNSGSPGGIDSEGQLSWAMQEVDIKAQVQVAEVQALDEKPRRCTCHCFLQQQSLAVSIAAQMGSILVLQRRLGRRWAG